MKTVRCTCLAILTVISFWAAVSAHAENGALPPDKKPVTAVTETPARQLIVRTFPLNTYAREYDGQWQGIAVASDGNCYFGASSHSDRQGGGFFRYDLRTKELVMIAKDLSRLCGEDPPATVPQGKIHSPIVEANGWLYFATHLGMYNDDGKSQFTGSRVLAYELATGKFRDYGVLRPGYSIYSAIAVDAGRQLLYAVVMPLKREDVMKDGTHIYRLDLRNGSKRDLGVVRPSGTESNFCLWMFVDAAGDCWFTMKNENGSLFRVRAEADRIERWGEALPKGQFGLNRKWVPWPDERNWTWAQALPDHRCLFAMGAYHYNRETATNGFHGDEYLWRFDPTQNIESGAAMKELGYIGPNFLGLALGGDRVYVIQPALGLGANPDLTMPPATYSRLIGAVPKYSLRSVQLQGDRISAIVDHGQIVDQDGRVPIKVEAIAADDERVYMVGQFNVRPGEIGCGRYMEGSKSYQDASYGLFFAVADMTVQGK